MDQNARAALQKLISAEHRLHEHLREQEQLAERWHSRAELAIKRGDDQLAGEALARKAEHERRARDLRTQYLEHGQAVRDAKRRLELQPTARSLPAVALVAYASPVDAKLDQLVAEDRLERDLQELKLRLASR